MQLLRALLVSSLLAPSLSLAEPPPWGTGSTLEEKVVLEKTIVCTDGKSHYVVVAPHERLLNQMFYGDGKHFVNVPMSPNLEGTAFVDPRFFDKDANPDFRGLDFRVVSRVSTDEAKRTCSVQCGTRVTALVVLDAAEATKMLLAGKFEPNPFQWAPHALARDSRGAYYYVDRGSTPDTEKSFRVFVGPQGALKEHGKASVVSDSRGETFSTRSGELHFLVGPDASPMWVHAKVKTKLTQVPVNENLHLVYTDLGVYRGKRLGTPCDDIR